MSNAAPTRGWLIAVLLSMLAVQVAAAQSYPVKPVRIVVPFPPGGINDFAARAISTRLSEAIGQPVVIDNRPGAGGSVGTGHAAQAAPDGYTLSVGSVATHAINQSIYPNLPYNVERDFQPIVNLLNASNLVAVHPSLPVRSVKELIALAKSHPGTINYGSAGAGTSTHLSVELFKQMTGVDMVHVPYKGAGPSVVDLVAGNISVAFGSMPSVLPQFRAGRLRALAVTGGERSQSVPDLPTVAEAGVAGYEFTGWVGMFAPTGTPSAVVTRIHAETAKILKLPDITAQFFKQGVQPSGIGPDEFTAFVRSELKKWAKVVAHAKARVD